MRRDALDHIDLFCIACRTYEGGVRQHKLALFASETEGDYVISGRLECPNCGRAYPVSDGVPCFITDSGTHEELDAQYLDAHYGEINQEYWKEMPLPGPGSLCLDAGCSAGRHTFDCGSRGFAVGLDIRLSQLKTAAAFQRHVELMYLRKARAMKLEPGKSG